MRVDCFQRDTQPVRHRLGRMAVRYQVQHLSLTFGEAVPHLPAPDPFGLIQPHNSGSDDASQWLSQIPQRREAGPLSTRAQPRRSAYRPPPNRNARPEKHVLSARLDGPQSRRIARSQRDRPRTPLVGKLLGRKYARRLPGSILIYGAFPIVSAQDTTSPDDDVNLCRASGPFCHFSLRWMGTNVQVLGEMSYGPSVSELRAFVNDYRRALAHFACWSE